MKLFFFIFTITIPIITGLSWHSFVQFLKTITSGSRGQAVRESVKGIGANLAGGAAGGVAVEIASKVLNKKCM